MTGDSGIDEAALERKYAASVESLEARIAADRERLEALRASGATFILLEEPFKRGSRLDSDINEYKNGKPFMPEPRELTPVEAEVLEGMRERYGF